MILGTGAKKVKAARRFIGACAVNRGYKTIKTPVLSLALLLCLCVNSWGSCTPCTRNCNTFYEPPSKVCQENCLNEGNYSCPSTMTRYGLYFVNPSPSYSCNSYAANSSCSNGIEYSTSVNCIYALYCSTQAEADSVAQSLSKDTETMDQLTSRCQAIDGEPHYQFNDDGHVVGYCDICQTDANGNYTNEHMKTIYDDYKKSCCEIGKAPSKNSVKCLSSSNACVGADCDWFTDPNTTEGGGIGYSKIDVKMGICEVNVSLNIDGVISGCEDEDVNSSNSQSSSSGEPTSGSSGSGEGGSSSSGEYNEMMAAYMDAIIDSLHKIIVIDSMNRTYDSLVAVFSSTIAGLVDEINNKERDTTIVNVNVPRDTNVINVNVGQAAVVSAIEEMAAQNHGDAEALQNLLRGLDSLGDTTNKFLSDINLKLDTLGSLIGDTTGTPDPDTSGWGAWLDSTKAWLTDSTFVAPMFGGLNSGALCDTTGGKQCESLGGPLDSVKQSWYEAYKALGDSLTEGAIADSLEHWESILTNNGVISGSGSNSCPSIFRRKFNLTIGHINVETAELGQYICASVPGTNVTFWTIARVVVRAMVAITCMWWLYGAVTGIDSRGGDDD